MEFSDNKTLVVNLCGGSIEQLRQCVKLGLESVPDKRGAVFEIAEIKKGSNVAHCFLRFGDSEIYNMILGKSRDGKDRVRWVQDPNWAPPHEPLEIAEERALDEYMKEAGKNFEWGAAEECMDEVRDLYTPTMLKIEIEPLLVIPEFEYTQEQIREYERATGRKNAYSKGRFRFFSATVRELGSSLHHNILISDEARISSKQLKSLKKLLSDYSSRSSYPKVRIERSRVVARYHPDTRDAQFALFFCKLIDIGGMCLKFSHAKKRDLK